MIDLEEFGDRVEIVLAARTDVELSPALADLPDDRAGAAPEPTARAKAGPTGAHVWAVMSGARRRGHWRVPAEVTATAFWGGVHLDLRNAVLEAPVVRIKARAIMGGVSIIVPDGVPVEVTGGVLMGGLHDGRARRATGAVRRCADHRGARVGPVGWGGGQGQAAQEPSGDRRRRRRIAQLPTSMMSLMVTDIVGSTRDGRAPR